jgi:hypothetical protein
MTPRLPALLAILLASTLAILQCAPLQAYQWPDEELGGIGGTGHSDTPAEPDPGGIGGTGLISSPDEGGIGGTGLVAADPDPGGIGGTGIIGVITGFGSIVVNGVHVDYPSNMAVANLLGEQRAVDQLAVGHLVEIEAVVSGERYLARQIVQRHALIGAVSAWNRESDALQVGGQPVMLDEGTRIAEGTRLTRGSRVMVSGLWDGQRLTATRIEPDHQGIDLLAGPAQFPATHTPQVGSIRLAGADQLATIEEGQELLVTGRLTESRMEVTQLQRRPQLPFSGRMDELLIEGYGDQLSRRGLAPAPLPPGRQVLHLREEDPQRGYRMQGSRPVGELQQGARVRPQPGPKPPAIPDASQRKAEPSLPEGNLNKGKPEPRFENPLGRMPPAFPERDFPNNRSLPAHPFTKPGPSRPGRFGDRPHR